MTSPSVQLIADPDRVVETLSAARRRILAALDEPDSATGLARRLGTTRQSVNYHLRSLEDAGLVELHEEKPRRGLTERVMRRSSDVILVDPTAFDTTGLSTGDVVGLNGVVSLARDLIARAAEVSTRAGERGQRVAAASLHTEIRLASPSDLNEMLTEIAAIIARHDSGGSGLRVQVGTAALPVGDP